MEIKLYNTYSNELETFESVEPDVVRMYNCGPTVYDFAHIGNFRSFLFADVLRRLMEFVGYEVVQVMNLTDVGHMTEDQLADGGGEDKMQLAARRLKESKKQGEADVENPDDPYQVAAHFAEAFVEDARRMGMAVVDDEPRELHMPRATDNVDRMKQMVETLVETGHAYVAEDGAVYYDVASFEDYGKLSGNVPNRLIAGAGGRLDVATAAGKRNPADFLLWKPDERHIMKWDSPWGAGYPGWHIECSAMALGLHSAIADRTITTLDIHTGGEDNIFPHHECEIAQATGATEATFANYWLHARHLMVEGEKMSKSKGNFYTVRDLLSRGVDPAVLRYELIRTHYRQNANFTSKGLADSESAVHRLRQFADRWPDVSADAGRMGDTDVERDFAAALGDDVNISAALGVLFKWLGQREPTEDDVAALRRIDHVLGVLEPREAAPAAGMDDEQVDRKVAAMQQARSDKDYATSDAIRDELAAEGVEVQITRDGITWRRRMQV